MSDSGKARRGVRSITASELKELLTGGPKILLVDVRPESERSLASIPGHTPLSSEIFEQIVAAKDGTKVVIYCHHGYRSMSVAQQLILRGVDEIYNLVGGVDAYSDVDPSIPRY